MALRPFRRIGSSGQPALAESPIHGSYFRPIPRCRDSRTIITVRDLLRSIRAEPKVPDPPARVWRDWFLVAVLVPVSILEGLLRPDLPWRWISLVLGLALIATLLWRRTDPLAMVVIAFTAVTVLDVARLIAGIEPPGLHSTAILIIIPYALCRWASGRHILIALPIILVPAITSVVFDYSGVTEAVSGFAILFTAMAVGVAVRFRVGARAREVDQAKFREREHLARELHDTVAHHVSAMAIRAQAGLAASAARPAAATEALQVIETEASRALAEMRTMVRMLRRDDPAELAPTPKITDLTHLADSPAPGPPVEVTIDGNLSGVPSAVSAAVYRVAQEAITNARRHARHATRIAVDVHADNEAIHLRVHDDGASAGPAAASGYGLVGMIERATLVGGTCQAGPDPVAGWTVTAVLPRNGGRPE